MSIELIQALSDIEKERGIPKEALIDAIKSALNTAYKKNFGIAQNVSVEFSDYSGDVKVFAQKKVVDEVDDTRLEIHYEEAQKLYPECELEDMVYVEATPSNFGRIAAQTAKQVIIQKVREAERILIYEEFLEREGEIITGTIDRIENNTVYIGLGRIEGIMLFSDQIRGEKHEIGQRTKAYIYEVKNTPKGPNIFVSRSHPFFLRRLFELEVPEIYDGVVEIKSISREAGSRSKISVHSLDDKVDAVGACVGPRGFRVQNIVSELGGEKIDIIKYDRDPQRFIANALSPSKVLAVHTFEDEKVARVIVPDYQLSLAIGKEGQNARLAARLVGWKIDIKSESQYTEEYNQKYAEKYDDENPDDEIAGEYDDESPDDEIAGEYDDEDPDDEIAGEYDDEDPDDEIAGEYDDESPDDEIAEDDETADQINE